MTKKEAVPEIKRNTAAKIPGELTKTLGILKKTLEHTQEQIALVHGVLEELCERQEALAAWQMEFSKRVMLLDEAQWRALEDLAGARFDHPMQRVSGRADALPDYNGADSLDEASEYFDAMSKDLDKKRKKRREKGRREEGRALKARGGSKKDGKDVNENAAESILVMPPKSEVH